MGQGGSAFGWCPDSCVGATVALTLAEKSEIGNLREGFIAAEHGGPVMSYAAEARSTACRVDHDVDRRGRDSGVRQT